MKHFIPIAFIFLASCAKAQMATYAGGPVVAHGITLITNSDDTTAINEFMWGTQDYDDTSKVLKAIGESYNELRHKYILLQTVTSYINLDYFPEIMSDKGAKKMYKKYLQEYKKLSQ